MGVIITYGSYVKPHENLWTTTLQVAAADTFICILAGVVIFPAVFAFNIEPSSGPGLVFITLPYVLLQMPGGYFFAILLFFTLAVAALTSSISMLEVIVAYLVEEIKLTRKKATIISSTIITFLGFFCSLSFGKFTMKFPIISISDVGFFKFVNFFDWLDYMSANILLPLGGLFISLFIGWRLSKEDLIDECSSKGRFKVGYINTFRYLTKYVVPLCIVCIFLYNLGLI